VIDDATIDIALYIKKWNEEDKDIPVQERKPIRILINSDGGSVDVVLHCIDMIQLSKTPIYTIGMGRVYSAGGLLLMAGHKRYIFKHTSCLIHDGWSGAFGSVGKMLDNLEFTKLMEEKMKDYILSKTKISEEVYDQNYRRDWFMFSEEMIELGIADEIVTDIDTIL
jgi:ATP-dependent Clp protease protease subunit